MTFANGRIPSSALTPLPGHNAGLLREAALAYHAFDLVVPENMALYDGTIGRTYRSFERQVIARNFWCRLGKCGNAAVPGTSNHGLGLAFDLASASQRAAINRAGRPFGFSKAWSDAPWEWWHIKYRSGIWHPRPNPLRFLGPRQRHACATLLFRRRRRMREARTGRGAKWRRWNRLVGRSYRAVRRMHRRESDPKQKRVLQRVLEDRNGTL